MKQPDSERINDRLKFKLMTKTVQHNTEPLQDRLSSLNSKGNNRKWRRKKEESN